MARLIAIVLIFLTSVAQAANPVVIFAGSGGLNPPSASGAGPATPLTGTNATWSTNVVTLDGTPDLSGVLATGAHAIYISTTTGRKFYKITAVDDGLDTVTTDENVTGTSGVSWAIGGELGLITNANAANVYNNTAAAGDWRGGWVVQLKSGYTETITATVSLYPNNLIVTFTGEQDAATRPKITCSAATAFDIQTNSTSSKFTISGFDVDMTAVSGAEAIRINHSLNQIRDMKLVVASGATTVGINTVGNPADFLIVTNCFIRGFTKGVQAGASTTGHEIRNCAFIENTNGYEAISGGSRTRLIVHCIFYGGTIGIKGTTLENEAEIVGNTFDSQSGDAITFESNTASFQHLIRNNIFSNIGGDAIDMIHTSWTVDLFNEKPFSRTWAGNLFFSVTGVKLRLGTLGENVTLLDNSVSPGATPFVVATGAGRLSAEDWTVNTEAKALGWPTENVGLTTGSRSFVDNGALQREEPAGGGPVANQAVAVGF